MDRLRIELDVMGRPAHFVAINVPYALPYQDRLVQRCGFPLFQATFVVDASVLHQAQKDDLLIYDADGQLAHYLPIRSEFSINMNTAEGYENVKTLVMDLQ